MGKEKYIIEKAKELFGEVGYKGTTMDLLATKCDMGKGTLYLYFTSKEDVLKSIVDQLLETINNTASIIENMDITFSEQIVTFLREMLRLKNEQIMVAKLVFEAKQMGNQVVNKYVNRLMIISLIL
jgi:AcrR family transcriptional regulator